MPTCQSALGGRAVGHVSDWMHLQSVLGPSAVGSYTSHGSGTDRSCLESQRGPLLQSCSGSFRTIQTAKRTPTNTTSSRWVCGQSTAGQTFQVPLHLASTARGEASSVTTGGTLNYQLMWLYHHIKWWRPGELSVIFMVFHP